MIFASDLDQTLIYSRKSFRAPIEDESIQLIETLDGKEISFISHKTISLLKNYNCTHISSQLQQELLSSFSVLLYSKTKSFPNTPLQVAAVISFITVNKMVLGTGQ